MRGTAHNPPQDPIGEDHSVRRHHPTPSAAPGSPLAASFATAAVEMTLTFCSSCVDAERKSTEYSRK